MQKIGAERGYSFVEMIFLLFLMGLLINLAVPLLHEKTNREVAIQWLQQTSQYLHSAQTLAMTTEKPVQIMIEPTRLEVWETKKQLEWMIPKGFTLKHNYRSNKIIFYEQGNVRGGTLQLFNEKNQLVGKITIQVASGLISWQVK